MSLTRQTTCKHTHTRNLAKTKHTFSFNGRTTRYTTNTANTYFLLETQRFTDIVCVVLVIPGMVEH